jgi:hypothetical protein
MADTLPAGSHAAASSSVGREGLVKVKVVKRRRRHRSGNRRRHYAHLAKLTVFWVFALSISGAIAYGCVAKVNKARPTVIEAE